MSRSLRSFALPLGALSVLAACGETGTRAAPFPFSRPELVELACIDPDGDPNAVPGEGGRPFVLPTRCCSTVAAGSPYAPPEGCPESAVMHALVSQSVRGEVAAVDLSRNRVLDSNPRIPGFTFIDVGGLPSALVVPPTRPRPSASMEPDDAEEDAFVEQGPPWTYVASAEDQRIRAIATCRFRENTFCGPENALLQLTDGQDATFSDLTSVPLPAEPADMLFGRDQALWVSLPALGALARVELSADFERPFAAAEPDADAGVADAGAEDAAVALPALPGFFRVPEPISSEMPEPAFDEPEYVAVCGVSYTYAPSELQLPLAPPAPFEGEARPTRMRLDESTGLLFVADANLPVLHVFLMTEEGALISRGSLPVGAPLRDFAFTAPVPATASPLSSAAPSEGDPADKRYLYGIDRRDGSVLAFELTASAEGASLKPLKAPQARSFSDRLNVPGAGVALDVIDTRDVSSACKPAEEPDDEDGAGPAQLRGVFVVVVGLAGDVSILDVLDLDLACRADDCATQTSLSDESGAAPLGVRRHAQRLSVLRNPTVSVTGTTSLAPAGDDCANIEEVWQGFDYAVVDPQGRVCMPRDPWNQLEQTWTVTEEGFNPGLSLSGGVFARESDLGPEAEGLEPNQFVVLGPVDVNLCARGAMGTRPLPVEPSTPAQGGDAGTMESDAGAEPSEGDAGAGGAGTIQSPNQRGDEPRSDFLLITSAPPEVTTACPVPVTGSEPTFRIVQAYRDRFVLEAESADEVERIRGCYPDSFDFAVRAPPEEFVVLGGAGQYLHRMKASESGLCVEDPTLDVRQNARAFKGEPFMNPYVAFTLSEDLAQRSITVQLGSFLGFLRGLVLGPTADFADILPASVRYFPYVNQVFVVDSASQGLVRFALEPFERTAQAIR